MDAKKDKLDNFVERMKAAKKVGRKPAITPELEEKIIADFAKGYHVGMVLALNYLDDSIFERALKRKEFRDKVNDAKAKAIQPAIDTIMKAQGTQAGAQWLLERRASDEWGNRNKLQVEQVKPIKVTVKKYTMKSKS